MSMCGTMPLELEAQAQHKVYSIALKVGLFLLSRQSGLGLSTGFNYGDVSGGLGGRGAACLISPGLAAGTCEIHQGVPARLARARHLGNPPETTTCLFFCRGADE